MAAKKIKPTVESQLESGQGGGGMGMTRHYGKNVPTRDTKLEFGTVPRPVVDPNAKNKGQMQFKGSTAFVGKEKATMFDRARQLFRRMGQQ